jgi:hypothetical protein
MVDHESAGRAAAGAGREDQAAHAGPGAGAVEIDQRSGGVSRLSRAVDRDRDGDARKGR